MTTIYIHIGQEKTGTTSLQQFFSLNSTVLKNSFGVLYPFNKYLSTDSRKFYNHAKFSASFLSASERSYVTLPDGWQLESVINNLNRLISKEKPKAILLSSEHFSSRFNDTTVERLASALKEKDVKIISYLRRQDSYQISRYSEAIKSGSVKVPQLRIRNENDFRLNYYLNLKPWIDNFGANNILIQPFELNKFYNGDLYKDFLNKIGISNYEDFKIPETKNTSLSLEEGRIISELNKYLTSWDKIKASKDKSSFYASRQLRIAIMQLLNEHRGVVKHTKFKEMYKLEDRKQFCQVFENSNQQLSNLLYDGKELFEPI